MTYKDITPTFSAGKRNLVNFKDFDQNKESEKEELKDIKRSFRKNEKDLGNKESKYKYNKVTHKMEDLPIEMIDDKIDSIEESCLNIDTQSICDLCCDEVNVNNEYIGMVFQWLSDNGYMICKDESDNNNYPGSTVL